MSFIENRREPLRQRLATALALGAVAFSAGCSQFRQGAVSQGEALTSPQKKTPSLVDTDPLYAKLIKEMATEYERLCRLQEPLEGYFIECGLIDLDFQELHNSQRATELRQSIFTLVESENGLRTIPAESLCGVSFVLCQELVQRNRAILHSLEIGLETAQLFELSEYVESYHTLIDEIHEPGDADLFTLSDKVRELYMRAEESGYLAPSPQIWPETIRVHVQDLVNLEYLLKELYEISAIDFEAVTHDALLPRDEIFHRLLAARQEIAPLIAHFFLEERLPNLYLEIPTEKLQPALEQLDFLLPRLVQYGQVHVETLRDMEQEHWKVVFADALKEGEVEKKKEFVVMNNLQLQKFREDSEYTERWRRYYQINQDFRATYAAPSPPALSQRP